jgi:hypothetical protein
MTQRVAHWARAWHYDGGKRDLRLDLLRGLAVFAMVVDHIGGQRSWLYTITGGDRFFVSAAEVFVFISGFLMGVIYTGVIASQGLAAALMKSLRRTGMLYCLTVLLTLACVGLSLQLDLAWAPKSTDTSLFNFILGVLTLHRTFHLTDVLLLYTLLVFVAGPVLVLLAHGYTAVVLAGAWGLWGLWQLAPPQTHFPWPIVDNSVFYFPTWQVLFLTAMVMGYHRQRLTQRLSHVSPWMILGISGGLVVCALIAYGLPLFHSLPGSAALVEQFFGKANLRPGRLLVFASFMACAWSLCTVAWVPIRRALGWFLLPLGQDALSAYVLHLFVVALLGKVTSVFLSTTMHAATRNTLRQLLGVACIWAALKLQPLVARQWHTWLAKVRTLCAVGRIHLPVPRHLHQDL